MKNRILTVNDLIEFCSSNNLNTFSSSDTGYSLAVQMPFEESVLEEDTDTSLRFFKIKALHIGRNNNGSSVTEDAAKKMMKNMAYKPLLANFTDVNGELDFTSHDVEITKDENGKEIWTYIEHQIGCFTADEPYIEHDDTNGRDYV